jgi:hypothetical protein
MQTINDRPVSSHTFKNSLRTWQANYLAQKAAGKFEEKDQVAALKAELLGKRKPGSNRRR